MCFLSSGFKCCSRRTICKDLQTCHEGGKEQREVICTPSGELSGTIPHATTNVVPVTLFLGQSICTRFNRKQEILCSPIRHHKTLDTEHNTPEETTFPVDNPVADSFAGSVTPASDTASTSTSLELVTTSRYPSHTCRLPDRFSSRLDRH